MQDVHQHRPLLFSIAYDILGEVQEAEDIVQDVFESWYAKKPEVRFPKAYLSRAVVNRSIDRLEILKRLREAYKGPWLPVPMVSHMSSPDARMSGDPLPYALVTVLEKLNPVERAAFILRRAFDFSYDEISDICDLPKENVRQIVHRAQEKLQRSRTRHEVSLEERQRLLNAFLDACTRQDASALKDILHHDVIMYADGGGKVSAVPSPIYGAGKTLSFLEKLLRNFTSTFTLKAVLVNGSPGALLINKSTQRTDTIFTFETTGNQMTGLYFVRNPEKILE